MEKNIRNKEKIISIDETSADKFFEETHKNVSLLGKDIYSLYFADVKKFPLLTKPAVYLLASNYRAYRNINSRNKIIEHNLRLATSFARFYRGRRIEYLDLIQEANIGLILAAELFKDEMDLSFSTFAYTWMKHFVMIAIRNQSLPFRIPVHIQECWRKIAKVISALIEEGCFDCDLQEIAKLTGLSQEKVHFVIDRMDIKKKSISLDDNVYRDNDEITFHEILPRRKDLTPEEIAIVKEELYKETVLLRETLDKIKSSVKKKQIDIFIKKYGFNDSLKVETLEEVACYYHTSRQRVQQIEEKILEKLRRLYKEPKSNNHDGIDDKTWFEEKLRKIEVMQNITGVSFEFLLEDL